MMPAHIKWHPVKRRNYSGALPWAVARGVWQEGQYRTRAEAKVAAAHREAEYNKRNTTGRSRWSTNPARDSKGRFVKRRGR